ncbi:helix-turn-helix domain-containing protein [Nitratidesulfovibrio vulgaris]|uniref:HTH merR-type domain-containing protein n=1 Tax=Nitratidesulfovibrio vulgaris (strain ATCC 29579 / DSM 644 / CCUG 34227 / NCIMB 8303 / VKM B-1760 / Hildenborough) TaxID=882 RepID=Q72G48_NITV2|nr:MerR family transcriptional regulator [Nitratidesulfovibrio vulgaris]AAS94496.1 hypothetical protein DVU_0012 [Nitratidesulfovibrio vulgaris str. Hildenborough]ADP85214.1 MerR family transcriptional regulator [Nitratidesulfovibrio vulgaris RCH1]WCB46767.1 MerR family transcriptional regulator [Nitratidesulfovibrio vulgaris]
MTKTDGGMTHKDLSRLLGVSETTVKSYRRKFPDCIPVANQGKPIRFTADAAKVCIRIRDLFELGMAVPEVRARLASEFRWIEAEVPADETSQPADEAPAQPVAAQPARVELPQDFTTAVSGLARSMVHLTQQQTAMMKRLQGLEQRVDAAVSAAAAPAPVSAADDAAAREVRELAARLCGAVERFEALIERLASEQGREQKSEFRVVPLLKALGRRRSEPEPAPAHEAPVAAGESTSVSGASAEGTPIAKPTAQDAPPSQYEGDAAAHAASSVSAMPPFQNQEPPRAVMTLPLVVQSPQGDFVGVAGRARGRFSCADFKAMLAYAFLPPEQYELRWEEQEDGWRLELAQPTSADPMHMVLSLRRMVTPRGNDVLCVTAYEGNGTPGEPWDLHGFIRAALG